MLKVKAITSSWKEGIFGAACPMTLTISTAANRQLSFWAGWASKDGADDKVKFSIEWESGAQYEGRFDLVHNSLGDSCLGQHIRRHLEFIAGPGRPRHLTPEAYRNHLSILSKEKPTRLSTC
jgi:hypothetical protein